MVAVGTFVAGGTPVGAGTPPSLESECGDTSGADAKPFFVRRRTPWTSTRSRPQPDRRRSCSSTSPPPTCVGGCRGEDDPGGSPSPRRFASRL